jgi:hypothetical protein
LDVETSADTAVFYQAEPEIAVTIMSGLSSYNDWPGDAGRPVRPRRDLGPLIVTSVVAAWMFALNTPFGAWLRGFLSRRRKIATAGGTSLLDQGLPLQLIRDSVVGRGKSAVAEIFGIPRTAAGGAPQKRRDFWSADTWYYPIDTRSQTAMAVRFVKGIARDVDFFEVGAVGE